MFNAFDTNSGVDRKSFDGKYKIVNGIPRNPIARTGFAGRGSLGRWGPNHIADTIVTRWLRNENGEIVYRSGKPVIEFLAHELPGGAYELLTDYVEGEDIVPEFLRDVFGFTKAAVDPTQGDDIADSIDEIFLHGLEIFKVCCTRLLISSLKPL